MPRGGRRGRFWSRFHRDEDGGVPPPPPPPNVEHLRWSFSPVRRGRRNLRPWLIDGSGSRSDRSPLSCWAPLRGGNHDGYYNQDDEDRGSHHSSSEICFICGDLVGNHPEQPSVHLCDGGDYAYVGPDVNTGAGRGRGYGRRHRRDHDPPSIYQRGYVDGHVYGAVGGRPEKLTDDHTLDWIVERLQNSQLTMENMNQNMKDLCFKLKTSSQGNKGDDENENPEEGFTENLVTELQSGLQDQYQTFLDQVRLQIMEKSVLLEAEGKRLKKEKQNLAGRMTEIEERQKALDTQEREVMEMKRKVEGDRAKLVKDSDAEKMEIRRQWQKLKDEVSRMEDMHKLQESRIKLDVGGVTFTTSTSTLTRDQESMLAAMFSGRHELKYEADGTVFIDRDGTHFRYILNFLRDGDTEGSLPDNQQSLKELLNEAVYYQIAGLVEAIEERLQ